MRRDTCTCLFIGCLETSHSALNSHQIASSNSLCVSHDTVNEIPVYFFFFFSKALLCDANVKMYLAYLNVSHNRKITRIEQFEAIGLPNNLQLYQREKYYFSSRGSESDKSIAGVGKSLFLIISKGSSTVKARSLLGELRGNAFISSSRSYAERQTVTWKNPSGLADTSSFLSFSLPSLPSSLITTGILHRFSQVLLVLKSGGQIKQIVVPFSSSDADDVKTRASRRR